MTMPNNKSNSNSGSRKILYMAFSIIVSVVLWSYVAYVGNPMLDEPMAISGIQVELTGEELLRDNNLIVSDIDLRPLTIYFGGRRNAVTQLSNTNVHAVVDLTDVLAYSTQTGIHSLNYDLVYDISSKDITVDRMLRPIIEVTVERLVTQTVRVRAAYSGGIAEGYMAGALSVSKESIEVAGTEAAIAKIKSATVILDRDNLSRTAVAEAPIKLLDEDGIELDMEAEGLSFINNDGMAIVTQEVLMVKEVPMTIDLIECASATDANVRISYDPATITLSGDPEILESVNVINLGTVDLKSFIASYNGSYQARIPNGANNLSGIDTVNVTIDVLGTHTRRLSVTNISYKNCSREVTIITQSLVVVLRGANEAELDEVMAENIRIVADLSEYANTTGTFQVYAVAYVDGFPGIDVVGEIPVSVSIS